MKLEATFAALIFVFGMSTILWGLYEATRGFIDHCMGRYKRIRNRQLDAAYRTGQFYVPYSQKDFK